MVRLLFSLSLCNPTKTKSFIAFKMVLGKIKDRCNWLPEIVMVSPCYPLFILSDFTHLSPVSTATSVTLKFHSRYIFAQVPIYLHITLNICVHIYIYVQHMYIRKIDTNIDDIDRKLFSRQGSYSLRCPVDA